MNKRARLPVVVVVAQLAAGLFPLQAAETPREYDVKAAFLLNFARFIEWPDAAFADARAPINLCVFEANPFGTALRDAVRGEAVAGRPLVTNEVATATEIGSCHLLFIPEGAEARALRLVGQTKNWTVTVGESRRFLALGGAVNLFLDHARVRFAVNLRPVDERMIRISARLLQVASDVQNARPDQ